MPSGRSPSPAGTTSPLRIAASASALTSARVFLAATARGAWRCGPCSRSALRPSPAGISSPRRRAATNRSSTSPPHRRAHDNRLAATLRVELVQLQAAISRCGDLARSNGLAQLRAHLLARRSRRLGILTPAKARSMASNILLGRVSMSFEMSQHQNAATRRGADILPLPWRRWRRQRSIENGPAPPKAMAPSAAR